MASLVFYTCSAARLTVTKPWPNMTAPEPRVSMSKANTVVPSGLGALYRANL